MSGINAVNNSPSFGMALKIDPSARNIIKKQAVALGKKGKEFLNEIGNVHERQLNNPVNIILTKPNHRKAIAAVIVDSPDGRELGSVDNVVISQPFFFKNGSLKFLKRLDELNNQVEKLLKEIPEAKPEDFGKAIKGQSAEDLAGEV